MKWIIFIAFLISINLQAAVFVEIRDQRADITTELGESYLGSYLYAMVSASSVHTDLYFDGDAEQAAAIFRQALTKERGFFLERIKVDDELINAVLVDRYCLDSWGDIGSCSYPVYLSRI